MNKMRMSSGNAVTPFFQFFRVSIFSSTNVFFLSPKIFLSFLYHWLYIKGNKLQQLVVIKEKHVLKFLVSKNMASCVASYSFRNIKQHILFFRVLLKDADFPSSTFDARKPLLSTLLPIWKRAASKCFGWVCSP